MKLKIISTGSVGNAYILENATTALIIECGVKFTEVKQAIDFNLNKVAGVLISHEHGDHSKGVKDALAAGLNVYASDGTIAAMGVANHHRATRLFNQTPVQIGEFKVLPFDVKHDCAQPFGFLINHHECGNVLFITDSYYVAYTFKNLHNIIVEANYSKDIVARRLNEGSLHAKVRDRVIESHMSLETCKQLLQANDLTQVNNIVLIHLSDGNSDEARFQKEIAEATGKTVTVARKGIEINFSKTPF